LLRKVVIALQASHCGVEHALAHVAPSVIHRIFSFVLRSL
jgi:hypothetical protein